MGAPKVKLLALLSFASWQELTLYTFMMIFLLCVLLWRLMYCNCIILFNSCFNLSFSIYCLTLRILPWSRWLSSPAVSLILLAHANVVSSFWSFMRSKWSQMSFLVKLWVKFVLIRGVRLNTILLLVHLVLTPYKLTVLQVCSLNCIKLLRLKWVVR